MLIIPNVTGLPLAGFGVPRGEPLAAWVLVDAAVAVPAPALALELALALAVELELDELPQAASPPAAITHTPARALSRLSSAFIVVPSPVSVPVARSVSDCPAAVLG